MRPVRLEFRHVQGEITMILEFLSSEEILKDAVEFLGQMNEADPKGFEDEQRRRLYDLEDRGIK